MWKRFSFSNGRSFLGRRRRVNWELHHLATSVPGAKQRVLEVRESRYNSESWVVGYARLDRTNEQSRKMDVRLDSLIVLLKIAIVYFG